MALSTWTKESKGLFFLKAPQSEISVRHFYLTEPRVVLADPKDGRVFFASHFLDNEFTRGLKKFKLNLGSPDPAENFLCNFKDAGAPAEGLWLALEAGPGDPEARVREGDVFRFGRQAVRVAKIWGPRSSIPGLPENSEAPASRNKVRALGPDSDFLGLSRPKSGNLRESEGVNCRICLEPEGPARPFERDLCLCSARMPAHLACLAEWLKKKCAASKRGKATFFDLQKLSCDICQQKYKPFAEFNGHLVNLLDISPETDKPAFLLEVLRPGSLAAGGLFLVEVDDKGQSEATVGRTSKSDLRLGDASVSRGHARFLYARGELSLLDLNSKFGTCRLVPARFPLERAEGRRFLVDKFMVGFHVLRGKALCECFRRGLAFSTNPLDNVPALQIADEAGISLRIEPPAEEEPLILGERPGGSGPRQSREGQSRRILRSEVGALEGPPRVSEPVFPVEAPGQLGFDGEALGPRLRKSQFALRGNVSQRPPAEFFPWADCSQDRDFQELAGRGNEKEEGDRKGEIGKSENRPRKLQTPTLIKSISGSLSLSGNRLEPQAQSRPFLVSQIDSIDWAQDFLLESKNSQDYFTDAFARKKNRTHDFPEKMSFGKSQGLENGKPERPSTLRLGELADEQEGLKFSNRTISDLEFEQCEDYEFN